MGRTARRTYELEDISIVPSRRTRSSKDVSTAWQIDAYRFAAPILSHPTDALVSPDSAIELGRLGALGVLNGEGLWARHADADAKIAALRDVAENDPDPSAATRFLQHLHSAPIDTGLLAQAVSRIRESGVTTAVRVSPQHAPELTPTLLKAGVELLVVHGTIISAEHVVAGGGEPLNLKTFIADLDVPVIAGGVHDHRTALHLMRTGAAGVIVGYGATEFCTTTNDVLGIGVPMATAIADIKGIVGSGHGWCLTTYDYNFSRIRNTQVQSEHHVGLLANQEIIIAIDAWEHAYFLDYGTKKPDYLAGTLKHLNWTAIGDRCKHLIQQG